MQLFKEYIQNHHYSNGKLAKNTVLACIDYGSKFIGLALYRVGCDPFILEAGRVQNKDNPKMYSEIVGFLTEEMVEILIIGIPIKEDGELSKMTKEVIKFSQTLEKSIKIPFYFQNELFSTQEAKDRMESRPEFNFKADLKRIDSVAATIILEDFINDATEEN